MESLKEKLSNTLKYFHDSIISNYKIIEEQEKIFYFSKFSLEISEFYEIYYFVHQIKKNVYNQMLDILKICASNYVTFNNDQNNELTENQKMIILYSSCLVHYYSKFTFNLDNTFEDFCSNDLTLVLNNFQISIFNEKQFKNFLFYFYSSIQKEIKSLNYERIKNLKIYYNANIIENQEKEKNNKEEECRYSLKQIQSTLLTFLAGTKARIVDLVLEFQFKNRMANDKKEIEFINEALNKITQMSREFVQSEVSKKDSVIHIDNSKEEIPKNNIEKIPNYYSKRVLSECIKLDIDKNTEERINKISKKLEESYLDQILNSKYKIVKILDHFICYIVEFNSKMLINIFPNEIIPDDISIRFIVPAKEIFNLTFESLMVLTNLPYTNINSLLDIGIKHGLQVKYFYILYEFFKEFFQCLFHEKGNLKDVIMDVLKNFYQKQLSIWDKQIQEKGKKLTSYYHV